MSSVFLALFLLPWLSPRTSPSEGATPGPSTDPELIAAPGARIVRQLESSDTAFEASLGGGLLRTVSRPFVAPESGDHWIAVGSRDGAGNLSPVRWIRLRVDGEPPTVEVRFDPLPEQGPGERPWLPAESRARVLASDAVAGVETSHLAVGQRVVEARGGEGSLDLPVAEDIEVRGWAVDLVGNRSAEASRTVSVDDRPPEAEVALDGPHVQVEGRWVVGPKTQAVAKLADAESGLERWAPDLDGTEVSEDEWKGPWAPGDHRLGGHALDRVGNRRDLDPVEVRVDVTGPGIRWEVQTEAMVEIDGRRVYGPPVLVSARAEDDEAGVASLEWSHSGERWQSVNGAFATRAPRVVLRAVDRVGNRHELPAEWELDEAPPVIQVRLSTGDQVPAGGSIGVLDGDFITVRADDAGAGVRSFVYSLDEGPWKVATERIRFVGARRGSIRLRAEDRLGNIGLAGWPIEVRRDRGENER